MTKQKQVAILSLGTELTQGFTLNTGIHYLSQEMTLLGYKVALQVTLPDDSEIFKECTKKLLDKVDTIIVTGGLGPTDDDKTRQMLADLANKSLEHSHIAEQFIRAYFEKNQKTFHNGNLVQALLPQGAKPLENIHGTAPGIQMTIGNTEIFAIPGVPTEMKSMFKNHLEPYFKRNNVTENFVKEILFSGISEPELQNILSEISFEKSEWSSLPETYGIRLRVYGVDSLMVEQNFQKCLEALKCDSKVKIISENGMSLAEIVVSLLSKCGETLGVAESCTGGMLASSIVNVPGSSVVFNGGVVSYSNEIKHRVLGVPAEVLDTYGAVSEETVKRMAEGARRVLGTDWALATSGIAGPSGGTKEKPVGLIWFAIAHKSGTEMFKKIFKGNRTEIREQGVLYIMGKLIEKLPK